MLEEEFFAEPDAVELATLDESLRSLGGQVDHALRDGGNRCGQYTLLQEIGEGGYGEVHVAVQSAQTSERVAVKILKRGLDTREILRRFEREQRALARIDHPNVAAILDAGVTDDGRPWFAMPFLDGESITATCDDAGLGIDERLRLFTQVCDGVQAAHAQGIVHRDLKPGNIIVVRAEDGGLVPKVIDFGIAKAVDDEAADAVTRSRELSRLGTPAYMSPEQLDQTAPWADTRSDVHALGVTLLELLSGVAPRTRNPRDASLSPRLSETISHAARIDADALLMSAQRRGFASVEAMARRLRGDLEAVVAKAMATDPEHRYQTAEALALELRRWLEHAPVTARNPTRFERMMLMAKRHRAAVAFTTACVLLVMSFSVVALVQASIAREQTARAETESKRTTEVVSALRGLLAGIDRAAVGGRDRALVIALLDAGAARQSMAEETRDPIASAEIATVLGDGYIALDEPDTALLLADAALERMHAALGSDRTHMNSAALLALGRLYTLRGDALSRRECLEDARMKILVTTAESREAWDAALRCFQQAGALSDPAAIRCKIRFWGSDRYWPPESTNRILEAEIVRDVEALDEQDPIKWLFYLRQGEMNNWVRILELYPLALARAEAALGNQHPVVLTGRLRHMLFRLASAVESRPHPRSGAPSLSNNELAAVWDEVASDGRQLIADGTQSLGADHLLTLSARLCTACAVGYASGARVVEPDFVALRADVARVFGSDSEFARQLEAAWQGALHGPIAGRWW